MTGPEHYKESEAWTRRAVEYVYGEQSGDPLAVAQGTGMAIVAQVHATLALAAATALASRPNDGGGMDPVDYQAWDSIAGVFP